MEIAIERGRACEEIYSPASTATTADSVLIRQHFAINQCATMPKTSPTKHGFRLKRVQDPATRDDGTRILVDRLWPRGVSKANAKLDEWFKEIAPSDALRKWFGHDPARWDAFERRYHKELDAQPELVKQLRSSAKRGIVTLLFAAKDTEHNNAIALKNYLSRRKRP